MSQRTREKKPEQFKFENLPSPTAVLHTLSDALKALSQPGLPKAEIQRWRTLANMAKAYGRLFNAYVKYQKSQVSLLQQLLKSGGK